MKPLASPALLFAVCALCSCSSYRASMISEWKNYAQLRPANPELLDGLYANDGGAKENQPLLWLALTAKESDAADVIKVQTSGRNLRLARLVNGATASTERLRMKVKPDYIRITGRSSIRGPAFPLCWVWEQSQIWLGVASTGHLSIYFVPRGTLMIGPIPVFGAGDGPGEVFDYRKMSNDSS